MKKIAISLLLMLAMILSSACAEAVQPADVLTSQTWLNSINTRLNFLADGSALMVNDSDMEFDGAWSISGTDIHFTYNFYGERSIDFMLTDDNGVPCLTTADGSVYYYPESQFETVHANSNADLTLYPIQMNEEINLGFTKLSFDSVETTRKIGGDNGWYSSQSGNNMLCLVGNLENTGNIEYNAGNIAAEFYVNDEYTYLASIRGVMGDKLGTNVPPLTTCRYYIYIELPDALEQNVTGCKVRFALNDQFKTKPAFLGNGEFCFEIEMDAAALADAMSGPRREKVCFDECPILPTPESYLDVRQSSSSTSSRNGKVTSIKYGFSPLFDSDDILALYQQYTAKLQEEDFTLTETGVNAYTVYIGGTKLAEISIDMNTIRFNIIPGNEDLDEEKVAAMAAAAMLKEYTDKATVKKVQAALNSNGYECGTPDGAAGTKTKAAISDYQRDKNLTVTGTITQETLISLGI